MGRDEFSSPGPDFWVDLSPLLRAVAIAVTTAGITFIANGWRCIYGSQPLDNRLF
jgi:hypothetical protein